MALWQILDKVNKVSHMGTQYVLTPPSKREFVDELVSIGKNKIHAVRNVS
jgi:hypothetical protein